jgi:hypothetical protein
MDEDLELMYDGFSKLPGFTAIKQDGLYIGIDDPYFGVNRVCCQSPDCVECSERASSFLNSFCHISVHASIVLADYTAQIGKFRYLLNLLVFEKKWLVVGGVDAYLFCLTNVNFQAEFSGFVMQSL